ncbi:MAG: hypothetical protein ACRD3Y_02300 [Bryobacteraceae bacterium]
METPESLDWVTARSKCSLAAVFETLMEVLDSDVKSRNALGAQGVRFLLTRPVGQKLIVVRERDFGGIPETDTVVFELTKAHVAATARNARGDGKPLFQAKPALNREGDCLLEVNGEELRLWQVSRLALEGLFFGF